MKKQKTAFNFRFSVNASLLVIVCGFLFSIHTHAQTQIAFLAPEKTDQSNKIREKLEKSFSKHSTVIDSSLSESVFISKQFENSFNLSLDESKNLGSAIGCNFFVLIKTDSLQRFSLEENSYFESYAAFYLVSSRTGRLVFWQLKTFKGKDAAESKTKLLNSTDEISLEFFEEIKKAQEIELAEENIKIEKLPDENSPEAKDFRPPLPFNRLRPEYTKTAFLYGVTATVDVIVDFDKNGKILRTEVARWTGFGLDESAVKTINTMNWRPAERNGEFLPMRILLRYNFKKINQ